MSMLYQQLDNQLLVFEQHHQDKQMLLVLMMFV